MADANAVLLATRLDKARKLAWPDNGVGDIPGALELFHPDVDQNDPDWCNVAAILYDNKDFPETFDKQMALHYFGRAAALDNSAALYNLAVRAERGYYGKMNQRAAEALYKRASDLGHMCAGSNVYHYAAQDTRYGQPGEEQFTAEADEFLAEAARRRGPWALETYAALNAGRPADQKATERMLELYRALVEGSDLVGCKAAKPRAVAARRMAMRAYLGIDVAWDFGQARTYLNAIPKDHWDVSIKYGARNFADKMTFNLDLYGKAEAQVRPAGSNVPSPWDLMVEAGQAVQALYHGRMSFDELIARLRRREQLATTELVDQIGFVCSLAREENWKTRSKWARLSAEAQSALVEVPLDEIMVSTRLTGPDYNSVDESSGFEVPGAVLKPAPANQVGPPERGAAATGISRLVSLDGLHNGDIRFNFANDQSCPAMLFEEDVDVVLALGFGDPRASIWPSFSLEFLEKLVPEKPRWIFERKDWSPSWLGHTAFGRSLYAADVFIGKLAVSAKYSNWTPEEFGVSKPVADRARFILEELALAGGREDGLWSRVMLAPRKVDLDWASFDPPSKWRVLNRPAGGGVALSCHVRRVAMRVEGSNCVTAPDGEEIRDLNLDDPDFTAGRAAVLMTRYYDELAILFPLLERSRQMMALQHAVFGLRARGFRLNDAFQARVTASLARYHALPALSTAQRLAWT